MELKRQLANHLKVHDPALWLTSREEPRCLALIKAVTRELTPPRPIYYWSRTRGLRDALDASGAPETRDLAKALEGIYQDREDGALCILLDPDLTCPDAARALRDLLGEHRPGDRSILAVSPTQRLHETLAQTFTDLQLPPLSHRAMGKVLEKTLERHTAQTGQGVKVRGAVKTQLCLAAGGMTQGEYERALRTLLLSRGRLTEADVLAIQSEKIRVAARDPLLRFEDTLDNLGDVGGMTAYKTWVRSQRLAAQRDTPGGDGPSAPRIKGILLVALPGCGQSIAVKGTAQAWGMPLIEFDGLHLGLEGGPSAEAVRRAIRKVEASNPCLLWLPRLDTAFMGHGESGGRPTTPAGLLLERWLGSKERQTIVIAGARDPLRLPLDLVIRGAFDQIFFLDLPSSTERREILHIALERRGIAAAEMNLEMLVAASDGFSGAQIVQSIDRGILEGPKEGASLKMVDLLHSFRQATPMAGHLGESRRRVRAWAHRWALGGAGQAES